MVYSIAQIVLLRYLINEILISKQQEIYTLCVIDRLQQIELHLVYFYK